MCLEPMLLQDVGLRQLTISLCAGFAWSYSRLFPSGFERNREQNSRLRIYPNVLTSFHEVEVSVVTVQRFKCSKLATRTRSFGSWIGQLVEAVLVRLVA